ncbi:MAG: cyclic pyranopterin monophosphate synthase MoaC [Cellulosilyticaceae bacterium]
MHAELTHFDEKGQAVMVDVSNKVETSREAIAKGSIRVNQAVFDAVSQGTAAKGDVLGVARVAGIMATKQTSSMIPMCHPLMLTKCQIEFELDADSKSIYCTCLVRTTGKTGVEMEALMGVSTSLLTIYDMCKAMDKGMILEAIYLAQKTGGKSGIYRNER